VGNPETTALTFKIPHAAFEHRRLLLLWMFQEHNPEPIWYDFDIGPVVIQPGTMPWLPGNLISSGE
jgi:hypothetical protein